MNEIKITKKPVPSSIHNKYQDINRSRRQNLDSSLLFFKFMHPIYKASKAMTEMSDSEKISAVLSSAP
ncbi:hypothetical protein [Paenibacillus sp. 22594]|uniref:hypothetical protein n=1 Tax=Paenibacillus sp. 22594 TaxID=3453947 RepID=UPI003F868E0B